MRPRYQKFVFAILLSLIVAPFAVLAHSGPAGSALSAVEQQVRHEILMLPFLGVFDHPTFRVEGSKVILGGEVYRPSMKKSIERAIAKVDGVESIENNIEVLPTSPHDDAIRRRLLRAIYRHPALDRYGLSAQPRILIIVKNGDVTLEGVVNREMEKTIATHQAHRVPGVFSVTNNLKVEVPSKS